jgi:transcriptional regulator with XRE-family HTH domain
MPLDLKKIRAWADQCGSISEAARRLGMPQPNLSRILSGDRANVTIDTMEHIADVMGVEAPDLIRRAKIV